MPPWRQRDLLLRKVLDLVAHNIDSSAYEEKRQVLQGSKWLVSLTARQTRSAPAHPPCKHPLAAHVLGSGHSSSFRFQADPVSTSEGFCQLCVLLARSSTAFAHRDH